MRELKKDGGVGWGGDGVGMGHGMEVWNGVGVEYRWGVGVSVFQAGYFHL